MDKKQLNSLFNKYINNKCTDQEIKFLNSYLDSFQDKNKLWSELKYDEELREKIWFEIKSKTLTKNETKRFSIKPYLKYAAVFVGLLVSILWYQFDFVEIESPEIKVTDAAITIKTSDNVTTEINTRGEQVLIGKTGKIIGEQKGAQISYRKNDQIKELVFNEISVPNGKKIQLVLSDGTLVHINSGSSLKFPISFISGHKRQVFLEGEAYFEVTKDAENSFQVTTNDMDVEVLGTHFNVSSYNGTKTFAVLAEGSIAVNKNQIEGEVGMPTVISPGEKATLIESGIEVKTVDLNDYLGWREGRLTFNNESFIDIIKKIERHYGVFINNEYIALNLMEFNGTFKDETILDLLDTFKESAKFNYKINNNKIIIYDDLTN